jgi:hypothetical protein
MDLVERDAIALLGGRRCSSTRPSLARSSSTTALRSGNGLPGLGVGSSTVRPSRSATQSRCSGHNTQAGSCRVQRVAPKSICAWV